MNILYLSFDGMTDPLGRSQVIPYLSGLSEKECNITIISLEKEEKFNKDYNIVNEILKVSNINWIPLHYSTRIPVFSTLYNIYKIKKQIKKLLINLKIDIVHCRSYPASIIGLWLKKKEKIKFVFDMRGFWADERVDAGLWNLKNPLYLVIFKYFKFKEIQLLNNADYIISLTNKAKEDILTWEKIDNIKIEVIPCCVDLSLFNRNNLDANHIKSIENILDIPNNSLIISYLGNVGTWYQIDEMLLFFKKFLISKKEVIFLIITQNNHKFLWEKVKKYGIDESKIRIVSAQREHVPYYLIMSSYSIFLIKKCYSKTASSPTKLGEILGMGVPVICNSGIGDVDSIVQDNNCGFVIKNYYDNEFQEVIDCILGNTIFNKNEIIQTAIENFSLSDGVKKYYNVYKLLIES